MAAATPIWVNLITRRDSPLLFSYPVNIAGFQHFPDLYGLDVSFQHYGYRSVDGPIMMDALELGRGSELIRQRLEQELDGHSLSEPVTEAGDRLLATAAELTELDFQAMASMEVSVYFDRYMAALNVYDGVFIGAPMVALVLTELVSAELEPLLAAGKLKDRTLNECIEILIFPDELSPIEAATRELTRLAASVQDDEKLKVLFAESQQVKVAELARVAPELRADVAKFVAEYGYINADLWLGEPLSEQDVVDNLATIVALKDARIAFRALVGDDNARHEAARQLLDETEPSDRLRQLLIGARRQFSLKQNMRAVVLQAGILVRPFLEQIARHGGLTYQEILYCMPDEIKSIITGDGDGLDLPQIRERLTDGYALYRIAGKLELLQGDRLRAELAEQQVDQDSDGTLTGTVAYAGRHEGDVATIFTRRDIPKMKAGDVLVAPMTDPYLLPAMLMAGAIVTDEGGLLSHAAIVAREQHIPCVVGTTNATKVLHDGDTVLVDATGAEGHVTRQDVESGPES